MGKSNPYRFSLGFDPQDPDHRKVADLLNSLGHKKTRFVVKAILAYCSEDRNQETSTNYKSDLFYKDEQPVRQERVIRFDEEDQVDEEDQSMIQKNRDLLKYLEGGENV